LCRNPHVEASSMLDVTFHGGTVRNRAPYQLLDRRGDRQWPRRFDRLPRQYRHAIRSEHAAAADVVEQDPLSRDYNDNIGNQLVICLLGHERLQSFVVLHLVKSASRASMSVRARRVAVE
jgi:hypothetical protein